MSTNNFSVFNTTTQASSLNGTSLASSLNPMGIKVLKGYVTPTAIGNYAIVDLDGNTIVLSPGDFVQNVGLYGPDILSAGAPTFNVGLAATEGGVVASNLITAPELKASIVAGYQEAGALATAVGSTNVFLSLTTAVAAVTSGTIGVNLLVLNANSNNF
jgi:hypothetical protein